MWKQLLDVVKKVAFLTQDTQKNKADIKDLQNQMEEMAETIRQVAHEIQRDRENQAHEREKLLLRLEVTLLRSEQRRVTGRADSDFLLEGSDQPPPKAEGLGRGRSIRRSHRTLPPTNTTQVSFARSNVWFVCGVRG